MLMRGDAAIRYVAAPDAARAGLLLYGGDATRVSLARERAVAALIGPRGGDEMRLTRIAGAELRRDAALLIDAVRAIGFFAGPRVVLVEDASDALAPTIAAALDDWRAGDGVIVVTAGILAKRSKLRALFEGHGSAVAIALYDDPPGPAELDMELARAGLARIPPDARDTLAGLARTHSPGEFTQLLATVALYKLNDRQPLTPEEIIALAPPGVEGETDALLDAVAQRRIDRINPLIRRLEAQGITPVTLCIAALRHFGLMHAATVAPGGPRGALVRARVFGPRARRIEDQLRLWRLAGIERAMHELLMTDLSLRQSTRAPAMALVERTLLRIAAPGSERPSPPAPPPRPE